MCISVIQNEKNKIFSGILFCKIYKLSFFRHCNQNIYLYDPFKMQIKLPNYSPNLLFNSRTLFFILLSLFCQIMFYISLFFRSHFFTYVSLFICLELQFHGNNTNKIIILNSIYNSFHLQFHVHIFYN